MDVMLLCSSLRAVCATLLFLAASSLQSSCVAFHRLYKCIHAFKLTKLIRTVVQLLLRRQKPLCKVRETHQYASVYRAQYCFRRCMGPWRPILIPRNELLPLTSSSNNGVFTKV